MKLRIWLAARTLHAGRGTVVALIIIITEYSRENRTKVAFFLVHIQDGRAQREKFFSTHLYWGICFQVAARSAKFFSVDLCNEIFDIQDGPGLINLLLVQMGNL